jgi:hypothetical protein
MNTGVTNVSCSLQAIIYLADMLLNYYHNVKPSQHSVGKPEMRKGLESGGCS